MFNSKAENSVGLLEGLYKKLDIFKNEVLSMQSYQKKMRDNLADAQFSTKNLS